MNTYTLNLSPLANKITAEHFEQLCRLNPDLRLETNPQGELIIMPPTGYEKGENNANMITDFVLWNRQYQLGIVCDSSTGFILPDGAIRSPDVSWIAKERVTRFSKEEKAKFLPLTPDFVLELMSPSDSLKDTQRKMKEYQNNGVKLGWLINPQLQQVEIYRLEKAIEVLNKPSVLSEENILPKLVIELDFIWR